MRMLAGLWTFVFLLGFAQTARGGSLDPGIIGMFPRNVTEIGYANLKQASQFPWFAQFKQQTLPTRFGELEQFLVSLGIDPVSQITEVAWAQCSRETHTENDGNSSSSANGIVGLASGQFDPESTKARLEALHTLTVEAGDQTLYRCANCGDLFIAFLDSNTIAFGQGKSLELMMRVRVGESDDLRQNSDLLPLIDQMNDDSLFWGVLAPTEARRVLRQMAPELVQFPQSGEFFTKISGLALRVRASDAIRDSDKIEAEVQLLSRTQGDALNMSVLLQAGLLLRKYEASQAKDGVAKILDTVQIVPLGNSLDISFSITNDQFISLVEHNIFVSQSR